MNIHDPQSRVYELTDEYDGRKAVPKNFFMLLESYQNHPEAKSLGPDSKPCEFDTGGLLQHPHVVANRPPVYVGKASDKHWEEGEDFSLLDFKAVQYQRKGYAIATDEHLDRIAQIPKREFMRRRINPRTLEKICNKQPVRASRFAKCSKVLEHLEAEGADRKLQVQGSWVESRKGAVTLASRWVCDMAFAVAPSIRFASILFPVPAHRTDRHLSCILLSKNVSRCCPRKAGFPEHPRQAKCLRRKGGGGIAEQQCSSLLRWNESLNERVSVRCSHAGDVVPPDLGAQRVGLVALHDSAKSIGHIAVSTEGDD
jgi:hypothetical protein